MIKSDWVDCMGACSSSRLLKNSFGVRRLVAAFNFKRTAPQKHWELLARPKRRQVAALQILPSLLSIEFFSSLLGALIGLVISLAPGDPGGRWAFRVQALIWIVGVVVTAALPISKFHLVWIFPLGAIAPYAIMQWRMTTTVCR